MKKKKKLILWRLWKLKKKNKDKTLSFAEGSKDSLILNNKDY